VTGIDIPSPGVGRSPPSTSITPATLDSHLYGLGGTLVMWRPRRGSANSYAVAAFDLDRRFGFGGED